jgi:hypothetical protein
MESLVETRAAPAGMTMTLLTTTPERHEAPEYYFRYINLVPQADIRLTLTAQLPDIVMLLESISEDKWQYGYAPDKWSVRQVVAHLNDTERLFAFRALWFARGFSESLPSFDQNVAAAHNPADERPWRSLVEEFREIRASTLTFFRYLPPDAWMRRGLASGYEFTVRAVAYIIAGHLIHHANILRERYLSV